MAKARKPRFRPITDPYKGFQDERPRRLKLLDGRTHEIVTTDGMSLAQACEHLCWPWNAVFWVDKGPAKSKVPMVTRKDTTTVLDFNVDWLEARKEK